MTDLLKDTGEKLKQYSSDKNFPFIMSISFGVAQCSEAETAESCFRWQTGECTNRKEEKTGGKDELKRDCIRF